MKHSLKLLPCLISGVLSMGVSTHSMAEEEELEFEEAKIFFELNHTDGDLGIHALVDGDAWKRLSIEDPEEKRLLNIHVTSELKQQGLTEIFFESDEPSFDELSPADFFARFPEGVYEIGGITLDGEEMESEVFLSHVMPAPVGGVTVSGTDMVEDCEEDPIPVIVGPVVLEWEEVETSHPELGKAGSVEVELYEIALENLDLEITMTVHLPGDATSLELPEDFLALGSNFKYEILVFAESGNKTAIESCFSI